MPRGPKGEKRPADVIGNAVRIMRIATGQGHIIVGRLRGQGKKVSAADWAAESGVSAGDRFGD